MGAATGTIDTRSEAESTDGASHSGIIASPNPNPPTDHARSILSGVSKAASLKHRRLAAELEAEEEIFRLEKALILKKLALKKTQLLNEEFELDVDDEIIPRVVSPEKNDVPLTTTNDRTANWVHENRKSHAGEFSDLVTAMTDAFSRLSNQCKDSHPPQIEKFLARQSGGRELPSFSGDPEDWPGFVAQFEKSTEVCGYSDEENMLRLQRCLKGRARESVKSILHLPEQLKNVMSTLALTFGRPGAIVKSMIYKVKSIPNPREDKLDSLIDFSNSVKNLVATMETLHCVGNMTNPQLLEDLVAKLPNSLKIHWGMMAASLKREEPDLMEFSCWLDEMALAASYVSPWAPARDSIKQKSQEQAKPFHQKQPLFTTTQSYQSKCKFCSENHFISKCENFLSKDQDFKSTWMRDSGLCFSCLSTGHMARDCKKKRKCGLNGCDRYHHRILHDESRTNAVRETSLAQQGHVVAHSIESTPQILFRLLPVKLFGPHCEITTHALFDEGSSVTLMDASLFRELGLSGERDPLRLTWVNESSRLEKNSMRVAVEIQGVNVSTCKYKLENVRTVTNLALPLHSVDVKNLKSRWSHLDAVNVGDMKNVRPRLLIGQDNCNLIIPREVIEGPPNAPVLSRSLLGWSIHGNVTALKDRIDEAVLLHTWEKSVNENDLHEMVKESFKTDNFGVVPPKKPLRSTEEERALELLTSTTKRNGNRWETGLLWRNKNPVLPHSYSMAYNRLLNVEQKMRKNPVMADLYKAKFDDYIAKGYAKEIVDHSNQSTKIWYIPHFPVFNPNKPGKTRIVFDAAAKSSGRSLNDELLPGPDLLTPLVSVLFKFRQREIGFGGDIQEMFHRVRIRDEDVMAQRFLWRNGDTSKKPQIYEMTAMIFGSTCSPCSAQYIKNLNAEEFREKFPDACRAIQECHYVDDYFDSKHTEKEAIKVISEVRDIHGRGGFNIVNWMCSSPTVLDQLPANLCAQRKEIGDNVERILGIHWIAEKDVFTFMLNFHKIPDEILTMAKSPTKREVLKVLMSLYDPLGFVSNFTVAGKILLQDIWKTGISWDDELGGENLKKWNNWMSKLPQLKSIQIPRCYSYDMKHCNKLDLHVFCDASEKAFSAVAYLRCETSNQVDVSFVMAKSRVSPLRPMSIPRLELQAAVLGCRLAETIRKNHDIKILETYYWTDSKTVICWLRSEVRKFKQFVAFRIGEILENSHVQNWRWVPTKLNPADEATRDIMEPVLNSNSRWLTGPAFLKLDENQWPSETVQNTKDIDGEVELRQEIILHIDLKDDTGLPDANRFSSWLKLIRATAWVLRFLKNCMTKKKHNGPLSVDELSNAEVAWWKQVQKDSYPIEVNNLQKGKHVENSSAIYTLCPKIDDEGILRLTGRLSYSRLPQETKEPVILPAKHPYTKLLIVHFHSVAGHNGMEMVTNQIRQKFWIPKIRTAVRSVWAHCQFCKNKRAKPIIPEMGPLPPARLQSNTSPFTSVGMDFFGPIHVRVGKRIEKRYGVLFTCLTVRAVHLEMAESLSTDSCMMAIRRMISRRGYPEEIFCDNGTNLKGAEAELKNLLADVDDKKIQDEMTAKQIKWHFNPPGAPHMGGAWERLIRSIKSTMRNILKEHLPTEEMLTTVMTESEALVNSRPLTFVSLDHEDDEALTPSHFLIGRSSPLTSPTKIENNELVTRRQWRAAQKLVDHFWVRWVKEYLPSLTRRTKWFRSEPTLDVGTIVIVVDPALPRGCWPKGKITKVFPGRDGKVRVAEVKTGYGSFRRPVTKLCPLDVAQGGD